MTKEIALGGNSGKSATVDDEDFEYLNQFKWSCNDTNHVRRNDYLGWDNQLKKAKMGKPVYIHREILGIFDDRQVDHINGNPLDNRRCNLRVCSHKQNGYNQKVRLGTSKYKGVYWDKYRKKWMSRIKVDQKAIFLGRFSSEKAAAVAYNKAATKHFGEFACLNTIP